MIGIVPVNVHHASSESSKSVYPIAIANCKENRWVQTGDFDKFIVFNLL